MLSKDIVFFCRYVFRNAKRVGLQELGPRFTLKLRTLQKGTFDSKFGEYEFIHKVFYQVYTEIIVIYWSVKSYIRSIHVYLLENNNPNTSISL